MNRIDDDDVASTAGEAEDAHEPDAEAAVRSMLRRARIPGLHEVDLLPGVQARIRQRSRGRFYGDGWSRGGVSASTCVVTAVLMLTILVLVYFVLLPGVRLP
jgi:hypothetical protein